LSLGRWGVLMGDADRRGSSVVGEVLVLFSSGRCGRGLYWVSLYWVSRERGEGAFMRALVLFLGMNWGGRGWGVGEGKVYEGGDECGCGWEVGGERKRLSWGGLWLMVLIWWDYG